MNGRPYLDLEIDDYGDASERRKRIKQRIDALENRANPRSITIDLPTEAFSGVSVSDPELSAIEEALKSQSPDIREDAYSNLINQIRPDTDQSVFKMLREAATRRFRETVRDNNSDRYFETSGHYTVPPK